MTTLRPAIIAAFLVVTQGTAGYSQDKEKASLKADKAGAGALAFSPDGKRLVSGGHYEDASYLWDLRSNKPIARLVDAGDMVTLAEFAGDGRVVVTLALVIDTAKTRLQIWNGLTGERVNEIPVDLGTKATISADGKVLVTANARGMGVQFYSLPDGQQVGELHHPLPGGPDVVRVSPDGGTVAACLDRAVWLGDSTTGEEKASFETTSKTHAMAFSPDGRLLVTAGDDGTVQCWDLARGELAWAQKKHAKDVCGLAIAPNGTAVATASHDSTVRVWNLRTGDELRVFKGDPSSVESVAFSRDSKTLAIGYGGGIKLWGIQTPTPTKAQARPKGAARGKAKNY